MRNPNQVNVKLPPYAETLLGVEGKERINEILLAMRPPEKIMTAEALRFTKASPLSFSRGLVDRMWDNKWRIEQIHCDIDGGGAGLVVYRTHAEGRSLTFAVHSAGLAAVERSGRIKDNDLDFQAVLFDGEVDLARVKAETEEQLRRVWKGRTDNQALGWTFANRSNRSFDYAVDALARGEQPNIRILADNGGYLIRNAGFYGNGRHGCRSWQSISKSHPLCEPYHVDLFCLYLWRQVGFDFAERIARARNPAAAIISSNIKRYLGVGNSSGIGMVAALVRWPHWVSGFCFTREFALATILTEPGPIQNVYLDRLRNLLARAVAYYRETNLVVDQGLEDRLKIARELEAVVPLVQDFQAHETDRAVTGRQPLLALMDLVRTRFSATTSEQFAALLIESRPDLAKHLRPLLSVAMAQKKETVPEMRLDVLMELIETGYDWALTIDFSQPPSRRYFWYRSEENGENRRGERAKDPGLEYETFIDVAGGVQGLHKRVAQCPPEWTVARYLVEFPYDMYLVSRIQFLIDLPYAEIRSNLIDETFRPSDLIQFYLSVLGMETTNPGNLRWVRGVFLQGAPLPEDILNQTHRDWTMPKCPSPEIVAQ